MARYKFSMMMMMMYVCIDIYRYLNVSEESTQEAPLSLRNSVSAAHVYPGLLTDRVMHRTPQNR